MKYFFTTCMAFSLFQLPVQVQSQGAYQPDQSELTIYIESVSTQLWDVTVVGFNPYSTDTFNAKYDANKIMGAPNRETLFTLNGGQKMSINTLNSIASNPIVDMSLAPGITDSFIFSFVGDSTFDNTSYVILQDSFTNVWHNIKSGDYEFWANKGENWNRFVLHFTPPADIITINSSCDNTGNIYVTQPGPAYWNYVLSDSATGNIILTGVLNQISALNTNVQPGTYTLTLTDTNNYTAVKTIYIGGVPSVDAANFTAAATNIMYNSPVSFTSVSQNAQELSWNFGDGTTASDVTNPVHSFNAPGVYTVTLTTSNGECTNSSSQTITVGGTTGVSNISRSNGLAIWSHSGSVYVSFAQLPDATIKIYDILGREISNEKFAGGSLYKKQLINADDSYVIVSVINEDEITSRKLFIGNANK